MVRTRFSPYASHKQQFMVKQPLNTKTLNLGLLLGGRLSVFGAYLEEIKSTLRRILRSPLNKGRFGIRLKKEMELFQKTLDDMEDQEHYVINASLSKELAHDLITIWIISENYFV